MAGLLLDTHAVLWYLASDPRLSTNALAGIRDSQRRGEQCLISAMSLVEVTYLVEKGRIEGCLLDQLMEALAAPRSNLAVVPVDLKIARLVREVPREQVADLPDRVIAATALALDLLLVSRDEKIRASKIATLW